MEHSSIVLIVDDEPVGRAALQGLLHNQGYHLAFAASGAEALEQADALLPDLILLDVMMPGMDGYEACRRLRATPRLADIPVIMVTALDDRDSRVRGIEAGADDYIGKPYDRVELRTRVATITRLNRHRRLLTERARFEWVVEHADDGYLVIDRQDMLVYANPQARRYLGIRDGQLPPMLDFCKLAAKHYHCEPQEAWAKWHSGEPGDSTKLYLVQPETATTQTFWLEVDNHTLPDGADGQRIVRLRNVTSQINSQRDMWKFHSMVTHKLRTPFIGLSTLELLMNHASTMTPAEIIEFSQMVKDGVVRLRGAIEDILQYISVPGIASSGGNVRAAQIEVTARELGLALEIPELTVAYQQGLEHMTFALPLQALEVVLRELLENAKKFHPQHTPSVEILMLCSGAHEALIQVRDDGITLTPEQLSRAWTPYYQGEKYFTGEVEGMGLGLPMVASLIWSIGGVCSLRNRQEGPGLIVELRIPATRSPFELATPPVVQYS